VFCRKNFYPKNDFYDENRKYSFYSSSKIINTIKERKMKHLKQEKYFYTIGKYAKPTLHVTSGEKITVDTPDNTGNLMKTEEDIKIRSTFKDWNPLVGPIFVEGAQKGDTLIIDINDIEVLFGQGWGGQEPGGISIAGDVHGGLYMINKPMPFTVKICQIENGIVKIPLHNKKEMCVQSAPFIGTIGTAPEIDSISSVVCGKHGGNMDNIEIRKGCKLLLPVFVEGALLYLGDVHALQGDGELNGCPVEIASRCMMTIHVDKKKTINWPRIESPEFIMTVGNSCPLDNSLRIACTEMLYWLTNEFGFDMEDAVFLSSTLFRCRVNQVVNPINSTVSVMYPKKYLC
jgi:acetamidase/formamidase